MTRHELTDAPGANAYTPYRRRLSADEREFGREMEIPAGQDVCRSCGALEDESDLWHAGGDGKATCTRCVRNRDREYQQMRLLLEQAVAVLGVSSKTVAAEQIIAKARNLLGG